MKCKVDDLTINYEICGSGRPILMLHGYYLDMRAMQGCMEPLFKNRKGWKRIYIDLPGMGKTESREWITDSDKMLDIVLKFIDSVIKDERFAVVGYSYGGLLARGIIYRRIEQVNGMLLLCPVIIPDSHKRHIPDRVALVRDEELLNSISPNEARDFSENAVILNRRVWDRYNSEIQCGVKLADEKFLEKLEREGYGFSFNVDMLPHKFEKPSAIIVGRQDSVVGYKDAYSILDIYPRASFTVLDKAGHSLQIEQDGLFTTFASEWVDRMENSIHER